MFVAALCTIAKTWKQPRCPSKDKVVRKISPFTHTHTHTHEYYSAKKNFSKTQMDLEDIVLSEIRERQILCVITYMWNLKNKTNEYNKAEKNL